MTTLRKRVHTFPSVWNNLLENNILNAPVPAQRGITVPAVNISEDENGYGLDLASPGMKKDDFKINLNENLLSISAEKSDSNNEEDNNFTRKEFNFSTFTRSFNIPESADKESITAEYIDGILKINISKKEEAKSITKRTISVN